MSLYPHISGHLSEVERLMREHVEKEDPRIYGMLGPFIKRGGKRIRPALCILCCSASGGRPEDAIEPASIIELFHNFTLIHDDIEDSSQFRRGEPTLHITHGVPMALNSGDALYTLLWKKLLELRMPPSRLISLQKLYADAFKKVVDGQGVELAWIRSKRFDVSEAEYLEMIAGKTSALMGLSCEAGAMMAGSGKRVRTALREYGELIGSAFQIQDDVLNLTGDFDKYKKEIGGDVTEGKRTLMVVHALSRSKDGPRLREIISSHTGDKSQIMEAISIMKEAGSIDHARETARKMVATAKKKAASLGESADRESLIAIADYVISREK